MQIATVGIASAEATTSALLEFHSVAKTFHTKSGKVRATTDVSLSVTRGELIALIGPSGCGKSTLLNMTAGLFAPSEGVVRYGGADVVGYNYRTGYMTQNDHLLPWRDVIGNIAVPLEIRGLDKQVIGRRVEELINLVGLSGFEKSYPSQLSGGMRKRCALARLLAYDPETLLMDEPFAALDAQLRLSMQMELHKISRRLSKTILFVTHDLDEAALLADRIVVFSGRPGTIRKIYVSNLPRERDLLKLRHDSEYIRLTAELWDQLTPILAVNEPG